MTSGCGSGPVPAIRRAPTTGDKGQLIVETPPLPRTPLTVSGRLREDVTVKMRKVPIPPGVDMIRGFEWASRGGIGPRPPGFTPEILFGVPERHWAGREVPGFVELASGSRELELLDETQDGLLAGYRDVVRPTFQSLSAPTSLPNDAYEVRLYGCEGRLRFRVDLSKHWSHPYHLEVQDVRYADGTVYYNEACQTYSRDAAGRCSYLVAIDPSTDKVRRRTAALTSNGIFVIVGDYIVCGYGFTSEPGALFIIRRSDGHVMSKTPIRSHHHVLQARGKVLHVSNHEGKTFEMALIGFDGPSPRLGPPGPLRPTPHTDL